ncbi:efflux RND transporter periplasmic adaptor subunit [Rouxiella chamberiensis]|uniref:Efflux RND transporter periplasmic adaptor subunit n=1 Tax=Rouxiella chamberiensis TaxID=1513468 RepID=A0ABY7HRW6_9GAMM|nr:efflux RND transporter periplasmic adaptor subunit [Rouxiella chamberiensis]WAT02148.1 efflux RND transporter periplasmic adaptor subunit [Rouxiella chamberiensis]
MRDTLEDSVLASGTLQPITRVDVGSQASGQLTSLNVNPGDFVKQGQLLGEIDPTLSQNALRDAEVALNSLLAQKRANQALVKRAYLVLQRQRQMYQEHATARQDVETAEADWQVQQAQLASMQAQIRQQQIRVDTARTSLGYTRIVAPVSGTVVSVSTQAGQTVVAAYQIPVILQIADLSVMTVKAQIPEADFSRIRQGLAVCFTTLGAADKRYCSTLRTLEPAPEKINNALFFNALFDIDNPQGLLRPDMTAQVSIVLDRAENVPTLPLRRWAVQPRLIIIRSRSLMLREKSAAAPFRPDSTTG